LPRSSRIVGVKVGGGRVFGELGSCYGQFQIVRGSQRRSGVMYHTYMHHLGLLQSLVFRTADSTICQELDRRDPGQLKTD
jgi:hypothetical protein